MSQAIAYLRTSSSANTEGDSPHRQSAAIMAYADGAQLEVDSCFWDAAVSGTDPIETRAGFVALLEHARAAGITTVIIEDATRFARSMMAQELGIMLLVRAGIRLVTASGQDLADESNPDKVLIRQIGGALAQHEKAKLVAKLKAGRDRVRAEKGKCGGRHSHLEVDPNIAPHARRLARRNPKTGKMRSLRQIAAELASLGYVNGKGKPIAPEIVGRLAGR